MGNNLIAAVEKMAIVAGWRVPMPDADGIYHFFFEEGLEMDVFSPDGVWCILTTDLGNAPQLGEYEAEGTLVELGRKAAAVMRSQNSVLSINDGRLELMARVPFSQMTDDVLIETVRLFLNDQAWWRESLTPGSSMRSGSPFSFGDANWFPSELRF